MRKSIDEFPEIIECLRVTGSNDCIIKAVVSSIEHMRILIEELGKFGKIDTSIVTYKFITRNAIDLNKYHRTKPQPTLSKDCV